MQKIIVLVALFAISCVGYNSFQEGKAYLTPNKAVTCNGVPFDGKSSIVANGDFKFKALGRADEKSSCEGEGDYTLTFRNSALEITGVTYAASNKVEFFVDEDGFRGLTKVDAPTVNVAEFSVELTTATSVGMTLDCSPEAEYVSADGVFSSGKNAQLKDVLEGADLVCRGLYNTGLSASQSTLVDGRMLADRAIYAKGFGPDVCKDAVPVRLDRFFEGSDKVQWLMFRVNKDCAIVNSGAGVVTFTGTVVEGCEATNSCPPPTCQELGNCPVEPDPVCSGNVCAHYKVSTDAAPVITDYTGDLATMPATTLEVNGVNIGAPTMVNDGSRPAGQVARYSVTSDGTGKGHWLSMFLWSMGNLTVGNRQSVSFCLKSTVTQRLFAEAVEKSASHQYANSGVWLEIDLVAGVYTCKTVTFTVRGDPTKVPSSVTALNGVSWATYHGHSKVADITLDR